MKRIVLLGTSVIDGGSRVQQFDVMRSTVKDIVLDACFAIFYKGIFHSFVFIYYSLYIVIEVSLIMIIYTDTKKGQFIDVPNIIIAKQIYN
jgi:hypothetical protein